MAIGLFSWFNKRIKNYTWLDIACTETYGLLAGLFIASIWPDFFTSVDPLIYLGLFVIALIRPIITFFRD